MITYGRNSVGTFPITFKGVFQDVIANKRWFRTNSGTTDYVQLAEPVVLEGDFEVEWTMAASTVGSRIWGTLTTVDGRFTVRLAEGSTTSLQVSLLAGGVSTGLITPTGFVVQGLLNTIRVSRAGSTLAVINVSTGAIASGTIGTEPAIINALGRHLSNHYDGILSDVRIKSADTLIHHWPMNEGSGSTHIDVIGGNHGTIINGQASDWELFEWLPASGRWLGAQLATVLETPILGNGSAVETHTVASGILSGHKYSVSARFKTIVGSADAGWGTSRGVPAAAPFRISNATVGATVGGDFVATSGGLQSLYGRSTAICSFDNISIRRILEVANA